jgi:hypothetical protein
MADETPSAIKEKGFKLQLLLLSPRHASIIDLSQGLC